eukprot:3206499-Rhodomonas_salina.1
MLGEDLMAHRGSPSARVHVRRAGPKPPGEVQRPCMEFQRLTMWAGDGLPSLRVLFVVLIVRIPIAPRTRDAVSVTDLCILLPAL